MSNSSFCTCDNKMNEWTTFMRFACIDAVIVTASVIGNLAITEINSAMRFDLTGDEPPVTKYNISMRNTLIVLYRARNLQEEVVLIMKKSTLSWKNNNIAYLSLSLSRVPEIFVLPLYREGTLTTSSSRSVLRGRESTETESVREQRSGWKGRIPFRSLEITLGDELVVMQRWVSRGRKPLIPTKDSTELIIPTMWDRLRHASSSAGCCSIDTIVVGSSRRLPCHAWRIHNSISNVSHWATIEPAKLHADPIY